MREGSLKVTNPAKFLVLGASGLVGQSLCAKLNFTSSNVVALSTRDLDLTSHTAAAALASLLEPEATVVFLSMLRPSRERGPTALEKNVQMARSLASALERRPVAHLILLSSDAVYPTTLEPISEKTPLAPQDDYGRAHVEREALLTKVCQEKNISLSIFRPCAIYGSGDPENTYGPTRFVRTASESGVIQLFGEGEDTRDHVFVDDLADLILASARRRITGIFNVASGTPVTFADVAGWVVGAENKPVRIESLERKQPVSHRRIDVGLLRSAFPECGFRPVEAGIQSLKQPTPSFQLVPSHTDARMEMMKPIERFEQINRELPSTCDITFYVPCLNEEGNVGVTLENLISVCRELKISFEAIVVDDASIDGTLAEVQAVQAKYPSEKIRIVSNSDRRGLARNYCDAAYIANGRYFMMICGDNAEPPESMRAIIGRMGEADMIVPVFNHRDSRPWSRRFVSKSFVWLVSVISGTDLDYYNGPVLHRRFNVMRWHADTDCFAYQAEIITRLIQEGASYIEVEVANKDRETGTSTALSFKNWLGVCHSLVQIALRRLRRYLFSKEKDAERALRQSASSEQNKGHRKAS